MTSALSSIALPHWLMIAGGVFVLLGLFGLAWRRRGVEAEPEAERELFKPPAENAEVPDRAVKEKRRDRWAEKFSESADTLDARS